jgi:hypothetical protein
MHRKVQRHVDAECDGVPGFGQRSQRDVERRDADWRRQSGGFIDSAPPAQAAEGAESAGRSSDEDAQQ